jgi:hypothetical protein
VTRVPVRSLLFLSSYSPLFIILGIRNIEAPLAPWVLFLASATMLMFVFYIVVMTRMNTMSITVRMSKPKGADVMTYVITYLLPFLAVDLNRIEDALSIAIFLAMVGVLYVHSNMVYVNPLLAALGYHAFEVEDTSGDTTIILAKSRRLSVGTQLRVVSLGDYARMERWANGR